MEEDSMWKDDNDKIMDILDDIELQKIKKFPTICPICREKQAHLYFHRYDENTNKGGIWIWCSNCRHSVHALFQVPEYWKNFDEIKLKELTNYPDYLEKKKSDIDSWNNKLLSFWVDNKHVNKEN